MDLPLSGSPRRRMVIVGASSMDRVPIDDGTYFFTDFRLSISTVLLLYLTLSL